jgi:hypothetical protein
MMDALTDSYQELEQRLSFLQTHLNMCKGADNEETLVWARFFFAWSKQAAKYNDSWAEENLKTAENFVNTLERSRRGAGGYDMLQGIMAEAIGNLNGENSRSRTRSLEQLSVAN